MIIGRERERADLEDLIASDKSEFVAVYGRRRIGKTFLIRETCRYQFAFEHTGLKNTIPDEDGRETPVRDATRKQYYWDLLRRDMGMAQNIDALLFAQGAELRREYGHLYASLFRNPEPYVAVIRALSRRKCGMTRDEIIRFAGIPGNGKLTEMLKVLEQCDFIRAYSVPGKEKHERFFQLIDNFTLFYFRFIEGQENPPPDYWRTFSGTQEARIWRDLAFERIALLHVDQIKRKLGISGVITRQYVWRCRARDLEGEGAQVNLVIERNDAVTNLCEMKCTAEPFEITDAYGAKLRGRRETFLTETGTRNAVHLTMVSANGLKRNANAFDIQSVVTLDDLFKDLTW